MANQTRIELVMPPDVRRRIFEAWQAGEASLIEDMARDTTLITTSARATEAPTPEALQQLIVEIEQQMRENPPQDDFLMVHPDDFQAVIEALGDHPVSICANHAVAPGTSWFVRLPPVIHNPLVRRHYSIEMTRGQPVAVDSVVVEPLTDPFPDSPPEIDYNNVEGTTIDEIIARARRVLDEPLDD